MTDVLFRYANDAAFFAAMTALGVPNNPGNRYEEQLGACSTPPQVTHQGIVRTVRLDAEQIGKIPDIILSPETVLIDWRSDEDNGDYQPTYTHDVEDGMGGVMVAEVLPGRIA